jgi:hypothetical protein
MPRSVIAAGAADLALPAEGLAEKIADLATRVCSSSSQGCHIIGSALLVQSFQRLRQVDPGYDTADIYTFQFAPEQERLTDGPTWGRFHLDFMDRLRALPGVISVGIVNNIPLDEGTGTGRFLTDAMAPESGGALLDQNFAGGDYFRVMGIDLRRGRQFTPDEAVTRTRT